MYVKKMNAHDSSIQLRTLPIPFYLSKSTCYSFIPFFGLPIKGNLQPAVCIESLCLFPNNIFVKYGSIPI